MDFYVVASSFLLLEEHLIPGEAKKPEGTAGFAFCHSPTVFWKSEAGAPLTNDAAEQAQAGGVSLPAVPRVVSPGRRKRNPKPNGAVELPAPGFHSDNGAECGLVAQELGDKLIWDRLCL